MQRLRFPYSIVPRSKLLRNQVSAAFGFRGFQLAAIDPPQLDTPIRPIDTPIYVYRVSIGAITTRRRVSDPNLGVLSSSGAVFQNDAYTRVKVRTARRYQRRLKRRYQPSFFTSYSLLCVPSFKTFPDQPYRMIRSSFVLCQTSPPSSSSSSSSSQSFAAQDPLEPSSDSILLRA